MLTSSSPAWQVTNAATNSADMPLEVRSAASAPSSAAIFSSTAVTVGLPYRE